MPEVIISIVISVIASSGFWAFLQYTLQARRDRKSVERSALLALLHDRLYSEMSNLMDQQQISKGIYENLVYLYNPYIKLGGDGTCEKMFADISKKELKP